VSTALVKSDPWTWLLGRREDGSWRFASSQSGATTRPPEVDPKVLLLRRVIPHPRELIAEVLGGIEGYRDELSWTCHRSKDGPGRHYWLMFFRDHEGARQFVFGLELIDRRRLALWFFSGFRLGELGGAFLEPYEGSEERSLPRFVLEPGHEFPVTRWLAEALVGRLSFRWDDRSESEPLGALSDESRIVSESMAEELDKCEGMHRLTLCDGGQRRMLAISMNEFTVGRHPGCNVVVEEPAVSTRHTIIELGGGARIVDLGSRNGSFVNGHRVPPNLALPLPRIAALRFGPVEALYVRDDGPEEWAEEDALQSLLRGAEMTSSRLETSREQARQDGVTVGEQLVLEGVIGPEDWARRQLGGGAFPLALSPLIALGTILALGLAGLAIWWRLIAPLH